MEHEQMVILYISMDGGYSYRQNRFTEQTFKRKLWEAACKWLRPDSDMRRELYGVDVIILRKDLSHIGILAIKGGDDLGVVWQNICEMWRLVKVEI